MKKMTILATLLTIAVMISSTAHAALTTLDCTSTRGTDNELVVFVADQNLVQVRVVVNGHHSRVIAFNKLAVQKTEGVTTYSILGAGGLLEVENDVLLGLNGDIKLAGERFSCSN